ncbi:unnamed protein product [Lepeophtheirus salmonis]|uniref:(salmon louse) hypothetical protein n=1 Tax=Lepeophtheirus salmonis TaxID=72036 RepID=A0A7R8CL57_LEPSM|nr:unnamed protein product [Lepeophtheirus salmonis]CAF2810414.1 unnamed protein product [Lepeophtheirus salmonis]
MKDTKQNCKEGRKRELNREEKERTIRASRLNLDVDSTKEEVTVVEHVQADESTTKLNKIDQCRIEEKKRRIRHHVETKDGKMVLRKRSDLPRKTCPNIKSGKNPKRGFESPKDKQKNRNRALSSSETLNKIDQCRIEERNGEYAIIVETSEEQSGAILDINNYSAEGRPSEKMGRWTLDHGVMVSTQDFESCDPSSILDSTKEEVTVVEHVQADESTTKLNKIDQCRIEERNGEYAIIVETSEEQSGAILDINNYSAEGRPLREDGKMVLRKRSDLPRENVSQYKVWKES